MNITIDIKICILYIPLHFLTKPSQDCCFVKKFGTKELFLHLLKKAIETLSSSKLELARVSRMPGIRQNSEHRPQHSGILRFLILIWPIDFILCNKLHPQFQVPNSSPVHDVQKLAKSGAPYILDITAWVVFKTSFQNCNATP